MPGNFSEDIDKAKTYNKVIARVSEILNYNAKSVRGIDKSTQKSIAKSFDKTHRLEFIDADIIFDLNSVVRVTMRDNTLVEGKLITHFPEISECGVILLMEDMTFRYILPMELKFIDLIDVAPHDEHVETMRVRREYRQKLAEPSAPYQG